ncbi:MAG: hypothetical protein Q9162_001438 [Coniocarpon cinnabarinum]
MASQQKPPFVNRERCNELADPDIANFVVSLIILIGLVLSYLPQHYRIIARRSSEGLSSYWVLLGAVAGTCAIANILTLPTSRDDAACCKVNSRFSCTAGLLGIAQISMQWACFFLIMFLFLIFIPRNSPSRSCISTQAKEAITVTAFCTMHFFATVLAGAIITFAYPSRLQSFANAMGLIASGCGVIQYFPQIYTTWKLQQVGSLSVPMMCVQTPGGFVFAASLFARLGWEGWSTWIVYVVLAILQGVLLGMAMWFHVRDRRVAREKGITVEEAAEEREQDDEGVAEAQSPGERSPLLRRTTGKKDDNQV